MAPAQHSKLPADIWERPWAKKWRLSWSSGKTILRLRIALTASTTFQQLLRASVWESSNIVIISYTDPAANQQRAHTSPTSGRIGQLCKQFLEPSFLPDAKRIQGLSREASLIDVLKSSFSLPSRSMHHRAPCRCPKLTCVGAFERSACG